MKIWTHFCLESTLLFSNTKFSPQWIQPFALPQCTANLTNKGGTALQQKSLTTAQHPAQSLWAVILQDRCFGYLMASGNLNHAKRATSKGFLNLSGVCMRVVSTSWKRCQCGSLQQPLSPGVKSEEPNSATAAPEPRQVCPMPPPPQFARGLCKG